MGVYPAKYLLHARKGHIPVLLCNNSYVVYSFVLGKGLTDNNRLVFSGMSNSVIYKVIEHLKYLLSVGADCTGGRGNKIDIVPVLIYKSLITQRGFFYYFGNVEGLFVKLQRIGLQL